MEKPLSTISKIRCDQEDRGSRLSQPSILLPPLPKHPFRKHSAEETFKNCCYVTMKTLVSAYLLLMTAAITSVGGFVVQTSTPKIARQRSSSLFSSTKTAAEKQTLGLLTFDLDDTLYPINKVEEEANEAFVKAMAQYGFEGLQRDDIVETAKEIRNEMNIQDPQQAAVLTHNQVRELAIRREMEKATTQKKLEACAEDWATSVDSLSSLVVANAKKYVRVFV